MKKGINVLSLFDGISCGQVALERARIKVDNYFASEIKKDAITVCLDNYPSTIQLGDVRSIDFSKLPKIDLLIGGSPCQDLSQANKERLGLKGNKSSLFWEYTRALRELKPKYFLFENVKMPKDDYQTISEELGTYPVNINSSLVSGQLRNRYYWTNIGPATYDLFGFRYCDIKQPKDKKIVLQDILTSGKTDRIKARCLLESDSRPLKNQEKMLFRYKDTGFTTIVYEKPLQVKVRKYSVDVEKLKSLLTSQKNDTYKNISKKLNIKQTKVEHWFRKDNSFAIPDKNIWFKLKELLNIKTNEFDKSITEFEIRDGVYESANRVYSCEKKCCCLTKTGASTQRIYDGYEVRYLNQIEIERLQTLIVGYTKALTRNKSAGVIGDGWTVDVIVWILSHFPKDEE